MTRSKTLMLLTVAALVFGGSFIATLAARRQAAAQGDAFASRPPLAQWLGLDAEQERAVLADDPAFSSDLDKLRVELDDVRAGLVTLFETPDTTDEALLAQIDRVIEVREKLDRRVAAYLIAARQHLTLEQQKKLFGLCAEQVRQCRQGGGRGPGRGLGRGGGPGPGPRWGSGTGPTPQDP